MTDRRDRVIVALDTSDPRVFERWVKELCGVIKIFKIGSELFTTLGPEVIRLVRGQGAEVFLDLKFHDIPNTVAQASVAATRLGVRLLNVHASGGIPMMQVAREAVDAVCQREGLARPLLLGVTVLTSFDVNTMQQTFQTTNPLEEQVLHFARSVREAGLDGVVASAWEGEKIKASCGSDFVVVTPGIRLPEKAVQDQVRVTGPKEAFDRGSDYIVIGRPITQAKVPREAAEQILNLLQA